MSQSARLQYERLLVELHREMRAGRSNSAVADGIRREMDAPWYELTDEEQALFDELSEDLYIIEGKRRMLPLDADLTPEDISQKAQEVFKQDKIRETLVFLRKLPTLSSEVISAMARCWMKLGFHDACVCFFDYADELQRRDLFYRSEIFSEIAPRRPAQSVHARRRTVKARSPQRSASSFPFPPMHDIEGLLR